MEILRNANGGTTATRKPGTRARGPSPEDLALIAAAALTLRVLEGKWKVHLLFLMSRGVRRYGRLHAGLPGASKKVMTETLRALVRDGLVRREVLSAPACVEYSLTPLGWTTAEPLMALSIWGVEHRTDLPSERCLTARRQGRWAA
jgi:DNA-binding HxlR family transcriptional regulator